MIKFSNLNVLYYITSGIKYKRLYGGKPFFVSYPLKGKERNISLHLIKTILSKERMDLQAIDNYRIFNNNKKGFVKIDESFSCPLDSDEIILQIHMKKTKNRNIIEINSLFNKMENKINDLEDLKDWNQNNKNIDLYYLYASPMIRIKTKGKIEEEFKPINYRSEIRNLNKIFENSKKEFKCIFECANEKTLRDAIIKQPKIIHISSHGFLNENREYLLYLEEKAVLQTIHQKRLKEILSDVTAQLKNIDLVFVSTCYSENLGKLFLEYGVKNVIYIQGKTPISDMAAVKFNDIFYSELVKGSTIKDAFDKSKRLIQSDKEKDFFQIYKCCCSHWHKPDEFCPLNKEIHNKYHIKCDCDFDEYNIHDENCKIIKLIKNDKAEKYFYFEKNKNKIKICCICCKPNDNSIQEEMLPHDESFKFILKQQNPNDNNIIFKYKKSGTFQKNKNCYIINNNDVVKNFSIVGRREQIKEIYDIIDKGDKNVNNIHFIIINGEIQVGKQNFSESVCIYLFERKVINGFWMIEIKESIKELLEKIKDLKQNGINSEGKYIIVIKINYYLEKPIDLVNEILKEKDILNSYFYYIILLTTHLDKIDHLIHCSENNYIIKYLTNLDRTSGEFLLKNICDYYGYSFYFKKLKDNEQIDELLEITGFAHKKIYELAELIGKGYNFEKIKEIFSSQDLNNNNENIHNNIRKIMEKNICKIYFLLSIMPFGFPSSMLSLYEPDFKRIIKKEDDENIIYKEPNNNWYNIIERRYKKEICEIISEEKRKECICKCLEIYAKLLFYYIEDTRNSVCFPDSDIHYQFNSYNNKGIWKTFDFKIYEFYFLREDNSKEYNQIIEKDFILEKHTENIFSLLDTNIDIIKNLIFVDNNVEQKEYLYQILLMLPSIHISGKYTRNIISRSLGICKQLKEEKNYTIMDSEQRLNLFLLSIKENPTIINTNQFFHLGDQGKIDLLFIKGLKHKDIESFKTSIKYIEKMNNKELSYLIPYAYYEIGCLYFLEKKYKLAKENLKKGLEISKEYKDNFIKYKIYIQYALIEETENILKKVINECENLNLIKEAKNKLISFKKNLEPDIIMLNSNPFIKKNNYSILHNSIWAYHNNQYYILQKINNDIKRDIRIKSIVLNETNLKEALQEKGKVLIIQSDDFDEDGEIMLENSLGEGEALSNNKLKYYIPNQLKYDVVILCFIKSKKLIEYFEDKVKYLITFDDINVDDIDFDMLYLYNKLSIDFIIKFIQQSTCSGIVKAYKESLIKFQNKLNNYKKGEIHLINKDGDYISLNKYLKDISESIIFQKKEYNDDDNDNEKNGKITYVYPLLHLPYSDFRNDKYTDDILHLIKLILSSGKKVINIHSKNDVPLKNEKLNVKTIISFEIMRFLYRHQKFNGKIFYVSNPKKFGLTINKITNSILGEKKSLNISKLKISYKEEVSSAFIVINNYEKIKKILKKLNINFVDEIPKNYHYLILSKLPIDRAYTYEITIKKQEQSNSNLSDVSKKSSKNKNKSKGASSKNQIINNQNKNIISSELTPKPTRSDSLINKKNSKGKKRETKEDLKTRYDRESDFTIIDHISSSDSNNSKSNSSESEEYDSDF